MINLPEAFERAQKLRDNGKVAEATLLYSDIATVALEQSNKAQAASAYHMAGDAVKMTIGPGQESKFRAAGEFFSKAYALFESIKQVDRQGAVLRDIAIAADKAGKSAIALESFQRSIELLSQTEDVAELAITYDKLGLHFTRQGVPEQALPYIDKALDLFRQAPTNGFYRATTLLDRGVTQLTLKNFAAATEDGEAALGWYKADHGGPSYDVRKTQCATLLSLAYQALGDQKRSDEYLKQSNALLKKLDAEVAGTIQAEFQEYARRL